MTHTAELSSPGAATAAGVPLLVETQQLTRHFHTAAGTVEAVRGVDITVAAGELVAFLGPNGAGKSTTLRMLTTLLAPTAGGARVCGFDIEREPEAVRQHIGYVGQGNGAGHNQRVCDELVTQARCYGVSRSEARSRADELLEALDLGDLADRAVTSLSGGQRRRLDVAMGLMNRPPLLFLDEPSTGLDPHNRANLWEHILRLREEHGMTVLLTTHYLDEADQMAERVLVIDHGDVIANDSPEALKANLAGDEIVLTFPDAAAAAQASAVAQRVESSREAAATGCVLRIRAADGRALLPPLLRSLDAAGSPAQTADVRRPTLDDVFLGLTGRSLREEAAA